MHIQVKHGSSKAAAKGRIDQALRQVAPQLQLQNHVKDFTKQWQGDTLHFSFTAQKHAISGTCEVTDTNFVIDAKLPLMWRLFEGKIERTIQEGIAGRLGGQFNR